MKSETVEIVDRYFAYLQSGNIEGLGDLFDENIVWHQPGKGQLSGVYKGKEQVFELFGEFVKRSEGSFQIDKVKSRMVNKDLVIAHLHFSAQRGNQTISMEGMDLMKVKDGKIHEVYLFSSDQDSEDRFWQIEG